MDPSSLFWSSMVTLDDSSITWSRLAEIRNSALPKRVALISEGQLDAWSSLAQSIRQQVDFLLVDHSRADSALIQRLIDAGYTVIRSGTIVAEPVAQSIPSLPGRITVLSSGTTGAPKFVEHSLSSLATMRSLTEQPARTWLVPYAAGTYAWYQLAIIGLTVPDQQLVPIDGADAAGWVEIAARNNVTAISATPTFWRRALLLVEEDSLRALSLQQLTLGGEPVDQSILDRLHELYPAARLSHIYASSEAGACLSVNDGKAGFPASWLDHELRSGVTLSVRDDMLYVRSPFHASGMTDGFIPTGDRVSINNERVVVLGRTDQGFINVGGTKVDAAQVANVLLQHPSVVWARVKGRKAPLIGQMPVAEVVLDDDTLVANDIARWASSALPEAAAPRIVRILDEIPTTSALKSEVS